jgi:hypothetical protein
MTPPKFEIRCCPKSRECSFGIGQHEHGIDSFRAFGPAGCHLCGPHYLSLEGLGIDPIVTLIYCFQITIFESLVLLFILAFTFQSSVAFFNH